LPFPTKANYRVGKALELVHGDLCGLIKPATPGGKTLFLLMVDDMSRYMWLVLLSANSDAAKLIKQVQAEAEAESGKKLKVLRTDRGGEFTSSSFIDYCNELGVRRHLTAPYSPQQNGVMERQNQTVVGTTRSMLKAVGMPGKFWGEAFMTAVYTLNRSPTRNVEGRTSYEAWHGKKSSMHHLRVFGCIAYMKITRPRLTKLDDRGLKTVFISYKPGSKAYRLYDPISGRVQVSRDVVFDENTFWRWDNPDTEEQGAEPFTVEYLITEPDEGGAPGYGAPSTTPSRTASPAVPPGTSASTPPLVQ
jgi:transposase InsO family protein